MKTRILILIVLTTLLAANATASSAVVNSQLYVGGGILLSSGPDCLTQDAGMHIATACFIVPSSADRVRVTIQDAISESPGGTLTFKSASGTILSPQVHFCTDTFRRDLPAGTARIEIEFWGPLDSNDPTCTATSGRISVGFT